MANLYTKHKILLMISKLKFIDKFREVKNLEIIESKSDIKRLSKDFYNYSPILTEKLDECIADLVVRPSDHKAVKEVAEICWELSIPLTLRGSGTGNYGQAVPLFKGVVMQMSHHLVAMLSSKRPHQKRFWN